MAEVGVRWERLLEEHHRQAGVRAATARAARAARRGPVLAAFAVVGLLVLPASAGTLALGLWHAERADVGRCPFVAGADAHLELADPLSGGPDLCRYTPAAARPVAASTLAAGPVTRSLGDVLRPLTPAAIGLLALAGAALAWRASPSRRRPPSYAVPVPPPGWRNWLTRRA